MLRPSEVCGVKGHPRGLGGTAALLEVSGFRVSREQGRGIVHLPPTRYLAPFSIEILTSFLMIDLITSFTVSFFITLIHFSWARSQLMEPGDGICSLQDLTEQIDPRPPLLQNGISCLPGEASQGINFLPSKASWHGKKPVDP